MDLPQRDDETTTRVGEAQVQVNVARLPRTVDGAAVGVEQRGVTTVQAEGVAGRRKT